MSVSICVSTYGEERWADLARARALPSADSQRALEVVFTHQPDGTVSSARNASASAASGDWLVFLDADDELAPGYVAAMEAALAPFVNFYGPGVHRSSVLLTPAVAYVRNGRREQPKFWTPCPLWHHNWCVIGTMVSRTLFESAGGFRDWGEPPGSNAFEDWALWAVCEQHLGAEILKVPDAVYVAYQEPTSRHRDGDSVSWHYEIGRALFPEHYPESWPEQQRRGRPRVARRRRG